MNDSIATLMGDRDAFNAYVYTHWQDALKRLKERRKDPKLEAYVNAALPLGIPECMRKRPSMVLFRHIATSNYEIHRFVAAADSLSTDLQPLILQYTDDLFNDRNEAKYFLGKLQFYKGRSKDGTPIFEKSGIIQFNESNNKPINSLKTQWNQSLVEFHNELFFSRFPHLKEGAVFDISKWLHQIGPYAKDYYKSFFTLFVRDGILFENFLVDGKEDKFTQEIILPAFMEIEAECGVKPLIVALEPTGIEADTYWYSHPFDVKQHVSGKKG